MTRIARLGMTSAMMLGLALPAAAPAADVNGRFSIEGGGLQTCGTFLQAMDGRTPELSAYGGWIDGYVTAQNLITEEIYDLTPWQSTSAMLSLVATACRQLPGDTQFVRALSALLAQLKPDALTLESDVVSVTHRDQSTALYTEILRRAQQTLIDKDYAIDEEPGTFGQSTANAFEKYQRTEGLPVTGLPDQGTLFRLFLASPG